MTDERRDDEILGRALARAIETVDVNETPYERSRMATAPARRPGLPLWQLAGALGAVVLAVAIGSWVMRPIETQPGPVGASPSATPNETGGPTQVEPNRDRIWVYFARDQLPPTGGFTAGRFDDRGPEARILSRLEALRLANSGFPAGATNAFAAPVGTQSGAGTFSISARVQGDLATVEFGLSAGWGVSSSAETVALLQQLVYTITEEPGIRRALITEKGKPNATIGQAVIDKPLAREDVFGGGFAYSMPNPLGPVPGYGASGGPQRVLTTRTSVDQVARGLSRLVIETDQQNVSPTESHPDFNVTVVANNESAKPLGGKWLMVVAVANSVDRTTGTKIVEGTPLRSVTTVPGPNGWTLYEIGLDDLRPWRTALLFNPVRIVVDFGGAPSSIFGSNAVYTPAPGATVGRTFTVSGVAHNFEAHVDIRVRDARGTEVYRGFTTATNCCDPGGTFETTVTLPSSVSGNVTLEVFEASARDGSDTKVIKIPLTVR